MKKIFAIISLTLASWTAQAEHISAVSLPSIDTGATGSIDLHLYGGFAPYTFSWTGPDGYTASTEDITGLAPGDYTVVVTDYYCGTVTMRVTVGSYKGENPSSIEEQINAAKIAVFPNPAMDYLNIQSDFTFQDGQILVLDLQGKIVQQSPMQGNEKQIQVGQLPAGVYILRIGEKGIFYQQKWIKE